MTRRLKGLRRILKVRNTQKKLKDRDLLKAGIHCAALEHSAQRIKNLQATSGSDVEIKEADMLSARMELSNRLAEAACTMETSIATARQDFAQAERQSFAARASFDGTEKLLKSRLNQAHKAETLQSNIKHNMLYNIDNFKKREQANDR